MSAPWPTNYVANVPTTTGSAWPQWYWQRAWGSDVPDVGVWKPTSMENEKRRRIGNSCRLPWPTRKTARQKEGRPGTSNASRARSSCPHIQRTGPRTPLRRPETFRVAIGRA